MQTKIAVEKTYWIGMSSTQRDELVSAFVKLSEDSNGHGLESREFAALNDLRQALLNV